MAEAAEATRWVAAVVASAAVRLAEVATVVAQQAVIAAARPAATVVVMEGTADIAEATAVTGTDVVTATAMEAGGSDSALDSVIPTTAAITAIRTVMHPPTMAADIIRTPPIIPIRINMARIPTALLRSNSMGRSMALRNNSNSMVRNMRLNTGHSTVRHPI